MADVEVDLVGDLGAFDGLRGLGEEEEGDSEDQEYGDYESLEVEHLGGQLGWNWGRVIVLQRNW
jgi:hypothetical protein